MERSMTDEQKAILKILTTLSNGVANSVWMAENRKDSNIDEKIDQAYMVCGIYAETDKIY